MNNISSNNNKDYNKNADLNYNVHLSKAFHAGVEKISFVCGYVWMNVSQWVWGKKHLALPNAAQKNIFNLKDKDMDQLVGLATSSNGEILSPVIDFIVEPVLRGFSAENPLTKELVSKYKFPEEILESKFDDFRNFIINSQLYIPISYYRDPVFYRDGDIFLLFEGEFVSSTWILENFRLNSRVASEKMFLPPFIVDKQTQARCCYLENGLTQHDMETEICAFQRVPEKERPLNPIVTFHFGIDSPLETPEDVPQFRYHSWFNLLLPNGQCYSFGLYGKGILQCPDPSVFLDHSVVRSISFEVTKVQCREIFRKVQQLREDIAGKYHFTKCNCSSVLTQISSVIGIDILKRDKIEAFDSIILRIKMYAISSMLAHFIRTPEVNSKIGVIHECSNIQETINNSPVLIQECISKFSFKKAFETISLTNLFEGHPNLKNVLLNTCEFLQKLIENVDAKAISNTMELFSLVPPKEIKALCHSILAGSTQELTHKFYNLFAEIFSHYAEYEIDSPGFVYKRLLAFKEPKHKVITLI